MIILQGRETQGPQKPLRYFFAIALIFFLIMPAGCTNLRKPARYVEQYTLEYPSPEVAGLSFLETSLKVERFAEVPAYNTPAMIYRPEPFKLDAYQYHRWRVHPADLIADYLVRDLRNSGRFKAVFTHLDRPEGRFVLEGGVEEFLEIEERNQHKAVMTLNITLLDSSAREIPRRILFQNTYRVSEPIEENSPRGLARGMSAAMKKFSEELIRDVHAAIHQRMQ